MSQILIDTSVWIAHWKKPDKTLVQLLTDGQVVIHDFIEGELACGNASLHAAIMKPFRFLRRTPLASHAEILNFIELKKLRSLGIGYVDVHLLYACLISPCRLYTLDKAIAEVAKQLNVLFDKE